MQGCDHFKTMWMPLYECLESCTSVEFSHVIIVSEGQPHNLPSCFSAWQLAGSLKDPACTAQAHAARPFLASSLETSVRSIVVKGGDVKIQGASSLEWGCSVSIWSPIEITYELEREVKDCPRTPLCDLWGDESCFGFWNMTTGISAGETMFSKAFEKQHIRLQSLSGKLCWAAHNTHPLLARS